MIYKIQDHEARLIIYERTKKINGYIYNGLLITILDRRTVPLPAYHLDNVAIC
jgi:hypothetical protein